mmetsp:Transcript_32579/g.64609  ORF Transcript_32579/g.64609 Transcript_32579/m.64609 type:complete len:153 (-) Transcript_32579:68-526(-)
MSPSPVDGKRPPSTSSEASAGGCADAALGPCERSGTTQAEEREADEHSAQSCASMGISPPLDGAVALTAGSFRGVTFIISLSLSRPLPPCETAEQEQRGDARDAVQVPILSEGTPRDAGVLCFKIDLGLGGRRGESTGDPETDSSRNLGGGS